MIKVSLKRNSSRPEILNDKSQTITEIASDYGFPCPIYLSSSLSRHFSERINDVEFDNMLHSLLFRLLIALLDPPVDAIRSCYDRYVMYVNESKSKEISFLIDYSKDVTQE